MNKYFPTLIFILLLSCSLLAQPSLNSSAITLNIKSEGVIHANIKLSNFRNLNDPISANNGFLILALPFKLDSNRRFNSDPSIKVSVLDTGEDYTLLTVTFPPVLTEVTFNIENAGRIVETPEGKAKLGLNLSFTTVPQEEKHLFSIPLCISSFDIKIELPNKYDETTIVTSNKVINTQDYKIYWLKMDDANRLGLSDVWIVFPSPMQNSLKYAELLMAFLISSTVVFFQIPGFRDRNLIWSVVVLVASLVVLGVAAYFTFVLAKQLDFLLFAAVAIPQTIYGLVASIYLIFAKFFQIVITGHVNISGSATQYINVYLYQNGADNNSKLIKQKKTDKNGIYTFYLWRKSREREYYIVADSTFTDEQKTNSFNIQTDKMITMNPISLTSKVKSSPTITSPGGER